MNSQTSLSSSVPVCPCPAETLGAGLPLGQSSPQKLLSAWWVSRTNVTTIPSFFCEELKIKTIFHAPAESPLPSQQENKEGAEFMESSLLVGEVFSESPSHVSDQEKQGGVGWLQMWWVPSRQSLQTAHNSARTCSKNWEFRLEPHFIQTHTEHSERNKTPVPNLGLYRKTTILKSLWLLFF